MKTCAFEPKECPNCRKYIISKKMKSHLSECETRIKCVNCGLCIPPSKKAIHDLLICIANDDRISCLFCRTLATEGSIINEDDMALHLEMHSKNRVEHSVFADNDEATYKPKDEEEFNLSFLAHIRHTKSHMDPIDICPKLLRRSKSYCRSRKRFREIEKSVESNCDLRNRIREGLHSYPPLTVSKSRHCTK
uniref:Uncharacterized protein LOC111120239 n=1 Tax=Crassostrea virginica TaxID=6565 RepID=A0A8B8CNA5_CRAVI|nr:uncharacterized protein LOC111120239 [Crassostrea virginica]